MYDMNMSRIRIKGILNAIKRDSTPYTPIIEALINSIEAIQEANIDHGEIKIQLKRANELNVDVPNIESVSITDNGIGFNTKNRESFNTVYSDYKFAIGGKGFGRFFYPLYFQKISVTSVYKRENQHVQCEFKFGLENEIIEGYREIGSPEDQERTYTELRLENLKPGKRLDANTEDFAHRILEQLLNYFTNNYQCPKLILDDGLGQTIVLNSLVGSERDEHLLIQCRKQDVFMIDREEFRYSIFKILKPRNQKSHINLLAHNRIVKETNLYDYVPEFESEFLENDPKSLFKGSKYIIHAYVSSGYLDENVNAERGTFDFEDQPEQIKFGKSHISRNAIESEIAKTLTNLSDQIFAQEITTRRKRKIQAIQEYATKKGLKRHVNKLDLNKMSVTPSTKEIDIKLHELQYEEEEEFNKDYEKFMNAKSPLLEVKEKTKELVETLGAINKDRLAHYILFRKKIIEFLNRTIRDDNLYESNAHEIIFPMQSTSEDIGYFDHNLWLLDENLNFTKYISSDKQPIKDSLKRPDLLIFHNQCMAYRINNTEKDFPISVFEFKRPSLTSFPKGEDPIDQLTNYVEKIRENGIKTIRNEILFVDANTRFFGYIVGGLSDNIIKWLKRNGLTPLPSGDEWITHNDQLRLQIKYIAWRKIVKDAEIKHGVFFKLLGLPD